MNIFINTNYIEDFTRGDVEKRFPLIYFWLKDYYYQRSENFDLTHWSYSDAPGSIEDNAELQAQLRATPPDIVGLSLYMWNADLLLANARWIKENINPDCIIVAAGPNADSRDPWMREHTYVDFVVNGPGGETFKRIIDGRLAGEDCRDVAGVSYWNGLSTIRNAPVPRKEDPLVLDYMNNFRDEVVAMLDDYTQRYDKVIVLTMYIQGCPYSCSFCEQGTSLWTKINKRTLEKMYTEIDLISQYPGIIYEFADANFGIVPEYETILDYIIANAKGNISLKKPPFAKNNVEHTFHLIQKMQDAGIYHSPHDGMITLQDPNPEIVKYNGRPFSKEYEKIKAYQEYTKDQAHKTAQIEIILGMPGQTWDTLWNSLSDLMSQDLVSHYMPYLYLIFPNTVLTSPDSEIEITYRRMKVRRERGWVTGWIDPLDSQVEMDYVHLTSTPTLSTEELVSAHYYWTLVNHIYGFLGWMRTPVDYLQRYHNIDVYQFMRHFAAQFHPDRWKDLPASIRTDIELTARWFRGDDELLQRKSDCGKYWLCGRRLSQYRFHADYSDFETLFYRVFDALGVEDDQLDDLMRWQCTKLLHFTPSKYSNTITSYNYDDIAQGTSDVYWKSKFTFKSADQDVWDKMLKLEDVNWVMETLWEPAQPSEQVELIVR